MPNVTLNTPISAIRAALRDKGIAREEGQVRFVASVRQSLAIEGYEVSDAMVRDAMAQRR